MRKKYAGRTSTCSGCGSQIVVPVISADGPPHKIKAPPRPAAANRPSQSVIPVAQAADAFVVEEPIRGAVSVARPDAQRQGTSGFAITSLVLGLLSFCLVFLTGVPAIIFGILGLTKINVSRGRLGGQGLAITGIILGGVGTLLTLFHFMLLMPAVQAARNAANRNASSHAMRQLALAAHAYKDQHKKWPDGFDDLAPYTKGKKTLPTC